jgi:hypothetical protein
MENRWLGALGWFPLVTGPPIEPKLTYYKKHSHLL